MTLGRTSSGAIKLKTDEAGGGLRAVECACCGGCGCAVSFPLDDNFTQVSGSFEYSILDGFQTYNYGGTFSGPWVTEISPEFGEYKTILGEFGTGFVVPYPQPADGSIYATDGMIFYRQGCLTLRLMPAGFPSITLASLAATGNPPVPKEECRPTNFIGEQEFVTENVVFVVNGARVGAYYMDFFSEYSLAGIATFDVNFS
jgi:hypothetical protein